MDPIIKEIRDLTKQNLKNADELLKSVNFKVLNDVLERLNILQIIIARQGKQIETLEKAVAKLIKEKDAKKDEKQ